MLHTFKFYFEMAHNPKKSAFLISTALFSCSLYATPIASLYSTTFSILSYAKWNTPAPAICVVNNPPLAQQLQNSEPEHANYKISSIQTRDIQLLECQVFIFSTLSPKEEQHLLNTAVDFPALSISTNNIECEIGSAFCLYNRNQKIAFKINLASLTQSKVHIDPRVLLLAKSVESKE